MNVQVTGRSSTQLSSPSSPKLMLELSCDVLMLYAEGLSASCSRCAGAMLFFNRA